MFVDDDRGAPSGYCEWCDVHVEHLRLDHILPLSWGGWNDTVNLQWLCPDCHQEKTSWERRNNGPWQMDDPIVGLVRKARGGDVQDYWSYVKELPEVRRLARSRRGRYLYDDAEP